MLGRRITLSLTLVCAVLGCDPAGLTLAQETADFDTMRALWHAGGIDDYYIEVTQSNEWTPPFTLGVEVRNGVVVRIRGPLDRADAPLVPTWQSPDQWERALAVDSLYAQVERAMANPEVNVDTRFDTRIGVPTWIFVDMPMYLDDSYGFEIRRFVRL